jgi:hypothetical protein
MQKRFFKAYATTESNDGPRVPIDAERIVFVLGEDDQGRPLEISIRLRDPGNAPPALSISAIIEPTPNPLPGEYVPNLVMKKWNTYNTGAVSVWHQDIRELGAEDRSFKWRR